MSRITVTELNIYPVKSLRAITLNEARIEDRGFEFDRRWMLVDQNNRFLTQREFPKMARIALALDGDRFAAVIDGSGIEVPFQPGTGDFRTVAIWNDEVRAEIYPDDVNGWFSTALGTECALAAMPEGSKRLLSAEFAVRPARDVVSFADGYPYLLTGEGSLEELNSKLAEPIPMNRFRPNIVVSGTEPFEEDRWRIIRIGKTVFHLVKPCARCVVPSVDQVHGVTTGKEPLQTLSTFRNVGGKVLFGQNLVAESTGGTIRIGDAVTVLESRS